MKEKKLYINRWQLFLSGACKHDRRLFKKLFGWRAELNAENMSKAMKNDLGVMFFLKYCRVPRKLRATLRNLYNAEFTKIDIPAPELDRW